MWPPEAPRSITARRTTEILAEAIGQGGAPAHIRSDNGPGFIAREIRGWVRNCEVDMPYAEPGSPWENGYAESFDSKVRDEPRNAEEFGSLLEARVLARTWRQRYDNERPHGSLHCQTPGGVRQDERHRQLLGSGGRSERRRDGQTGRWVGDE